MLKEKLNTFAKVSLLVDILLTVLSFIMAFYLRGMLFFDPVGKEEWVSGNVLWLVPWIVFVWAVVLYYEDAYNPFSSRGVVFCTAKAIIEAMAILAIVIFFKKAVTQSRLFIGFFGCINMFVLLTWRKASFLFFQKYNVLVIGTGKRAKRFYDYFTHHAPLKFRSLSFLTIEGENGILDKIAIGDVTNFENTLKSHSIDWVILLSDTTSTNPEILNLCENAGIPVSSVLSDFSGRIDVETYSEFKFITFSTAPFASLSFLLKYSLDFLFAVCTLVLSIPLFLIIAFLIKVDSKGTLLFKQIRCGLNGRNFTFYKFRTMFGEAEEMKEALIPFSEINGPAFKMKNDPRVTRVGRVLRRFSLDELPQIINILKGDMSFVGPRPPLPSEVKEYEKWQMRKLSMRPGLTCIWQVSGRNEIDFDDWMRYDLEYIDNWSLFLDLQVLIKTVPAVLCGRGAY